MITVISITTNCDRLGGPVPLRAPGCLLALELLQKQRRVFIFLLLILVRATLELAVGRRDLWREVGPGALGKEGEGGAGRRVLVNVHADEVRKACEVFCPDRLPEHHWKLLVGALEANLPLPPNDGIELGEVTGRGQMTQVGDQHGIGRVDIEVLQ